MRRRRKGDVVNVSVLDSVCDDVPGVMVVFALAGGNILERCGLCQVGISLREGGCDNIAVPDLCGGGGLS